MIPILIKSNGENNMKEIITKVTGVTVYTNKARIEREGKTVLKGGRETLSITGLPSKLLPESLRIKAKGREQIKIEGIDLKKTFFKNIPDGIVRELSDKIYKLEMKKKKVEDQMSILDNEKKHLEGVWKSSRIFASGFAKGESSVENHKNLMAFLSKEGISTLSDLRKREIEKKEIEDEITKLREELNLANNSKPKQRYTAEVAINSENNSEISLIVFYHISGASWVPEYDIRLNENELFIGYYAGIKQRTGEDWNDVSITLSTIAPSGISSVPEPGPWYISPFKPAPRRLDSTKSKTLAAPGIRLPGDDTPYSEIIREEFPDSEESDFESAEVIRSTVSVSYKISNLCTVPGDGSPHKTMIDELKFEKKIKYITFPEIEEKVFRLACIENRDLFLLPGKGQIFDNNEYIGPVSIKHTSPGEEMEIFAGTDDGIKVKKKLISRETDKKLLSDRKKIDYSFEITVENFKNSEEEITVKERIPLSTHEDIKIKFDESNPEVSKADKMNNLEWKIKVSPSEKKKITYGFSIEFPRDMDVRKLP